MISVDFVFLTGVKRELFRNARLVGSWNGWAESPMTATFGEDGCPAFVGTVHFDDGLAGEHFDWGLRFDGPEGNDRWGINLEVPLPDSTDRTRTVTLPASGVPRTETYRFSYGRYLGAQKLYPDAGAPVARFAVWAPHARAVDVVFGRTDNGYISDDGTGIDPAQPVIALSAEASGIWAGTAPGAFSRYTGLPYMFRVVNAQGRTVFRTDLFSRWQIGRGDQDPDGRRWDLGPETLDGGVSCSVVVDQDVVREEFEPTTTPPRQIADEEFWLTEFTAGKPVPTRVEDLIVYELHVGALGFGRTGAGTLLDAMELVPYLVDLGVNAVELLPISETSGTLSWGYGDTHHFVIESSAGGRDKYKHFVRECHRNGIAVLQDVVYNHFDANATRAEWQYDSEAPEQNGYYWYEGSPSDYPNPTGGYLDNGSSGWSPRFSEETVRQLFIGSAAEFVEEFHVDGLRVDLTQAIHRDNTLVADGRSVGRANQFGQKLLREWTRTLRMMRPAAILVAEDHSDWSAVTQSVDQGGLGFDSTWYADFYHNLIGDAEQSSGKARLLKAAGFGSDGPLPMGRFAASLVHSRDNKVVYHESHDEAGNDRGSLRTVRVAVNDAPLLGPTRDAAESRSRTAAGLTMLSPGTPLFFMGEEVAAQKDFIYDNVIGAKEDLHGERAGQGARMFTFYQDVIRLTRDDRAIRSHDIDVIHAADSSRVIAFTRGDVREQSLVVASLSNDAFAAGYVIQTDPGRLDGRWKEVFNSDSRRYGGADLGNFGATISAEQGRIDLRIPANGFVVLQRV